MALRQELEKVIGTSTPLDTGGRRSPLPLEATPEAFMVVLLDEMAGRLAEIEGRLSEMQAEGVMVDVEVHITENLTIVTFPKLLRSIDIFNDGPGTVFYNFNGGAVQRQGGLKNGEPIGYNANRPILGRIDLRVGIGMSESDVRLKGWT